MESAQSVSENVLWWREREREMKSCRVSCRRCAATVEDREVRGQRFWHLSWLFSSIVPSLLSSSSHLVSSLLCLVSSVLLSFLFLSPFFCRLISAHRLSPHLLSCPLLSLSSPVSLRLSSSSFCLISSSFFIPHLLITDVDVYWNQSDDDDDDVRMLQCRDFIVDNAEDRLQHHKTHDN